MNEARRDRSWLRPWLVAGMALWLVIGVVLVDRANRQGLVNDIELSPAHVVAYFGLAVLGLYVLWAFFRGLRHGHWRQSFPPGYGGLGLGFAVAIGWIVLDSIWRATLGIGPGIANGLAPPRLLVPLVIVLVASGPVREALERARGPASSSLRTAAPAVVGLAIIGSAVSLTAFNPVREPWNDMALDPARDSAEIWTMAADGSGQTRVLPVVETGIDFSLPAWSPDGATIAYTRWKNNGGAPINLRSEDQTASIWTMAADGSGARMIVEGAPGRAWIPAWSPDGQWIAYTLSPNAAPVPAAGAQPEPNAAPGVVGPPSAAAGAELWLVHPDGTGARQLTNRRGDAAAAAWSPDGRQIAFNSSVSGGLSDIHVATVSDAGLTDERALVADPANDWSPAWSPDGKRLAFSSDRTGNDEIWTVAIDGTGLTRLTDNSDGDWVPTWSVDGSRIVFVSDRNGDVDIWSMAADGTDQRDLTNSPGTDDGRWSVAVSPNGRLAYTSAAYRTGAASSWVREDFAAAVTILWGICLAVIALLLVALGAPLGGYTIALTLLIALSAAPSDQWRFLPGAIIGGIVVDVLVRGSPMARRARVAATALPLAGVLAIGLTLSLAGTAAWSLTLLLGVAAAVALLGWGLAEAVRRLAPAEA